MKKRKWIVVSAIFLSVSAAVAGFTMMKAGAISGILPFLHKGEQATATSGTPTGNDSDGAQIAGENVELFDSDQQKVVSHYSNSTLFQQEAQTILHSVSGRVQDISPQLEHCYILKIPVDPPIKVSVPKEKMKDHISRVFVVMPKNGKRKPWLILHNQREETILAEFTRDVSTIRELIKK
ncbi:hypothetical protein J5TS2_44310 [Brevibacillus halotolerans]|uniref:hypothetical protein n=1 Tax=Brevibacillus halotolerans TaxID=1507437 RepID=UPI001B0C27A5|nr:hypothetical protein [Brevibacillus halotolerans]GIO03763.1 hypothetical protein J5TS2_44310 [Brevibacillus halotolerans]